MICLAGGEAVLWVLYECCVRLCTQSCLSSILCCVFKSTCPPGYSSRVKHYFHMSNLDGCFVPLEHAKQPQQKQIDEHGLAITPEFVIDIRLPHVLHQNKTSMLVSLSESTCAIHRDY